MASYNNCFCLKQIRKISNLEYKSRKFNKNTIIHFKYIVVVVRGFALKDFESLLQLRN